MKSIIQICIVISLFAYWAISLPTFSQSFLARAFGPNGSLLGTSQAWTQSGILVTKFYTASKSGYYLQGSNLYYSTSGAMDGDYAVTNDTIKFNTPTNFTGNMKFAWDTYRDGIFYDTVIESGSATISFKAPTYKYDVKFVKTSGVYKGTIDNFNCTLTVDTDPKLDGTPSNITTGLNPDLRIPAQTALTNSWWPKVKTQLQTMLDNFLTIAQTGQSLSWTYSSFSLSKTLQLAPSDSTPMVADMFVINGNATLTITDGEITSFDLPIEEEHDDVKLVSDAGLKAQVDDSCVTLSKDLVSSMITTNVNFYKQYMILVNQASQSQKYYPFNFWQYWEATLYDLRLYDKIGTTAGKYKQTDPLSIKCNYTQTLSTTIITDGSIQLTNRFNCSLDLVDSNNGNMVTQLYIFQFDHTTTSTFYMSGTYLNAKVNSGSITNVNNIILNSQPILSDLTDRFKVPFNQQFIDNCKLFGKNGIKLDYATGKKVAAAKIGEDLQVCFK